MDTKKARLYSIGSLLFVYAFILSASAQSFSAAGMADRYNINWNTQSNNSSESMPCGGGSIGLNVWVESGDILFYISEGGMFDENNQLLKAGRVRLHIPGDPFAGTDFKQELKLQEGYVRISGHHTSVDIWTDVFRPVIHLDITCKTPAHAKVSFESWRFEDHIIEGNEFRANSYKIPQENPVRTYKDSISFSNGAVLFYHRNRPDIKNIVEHTVELEGMRAVMNQMYDPLTNNTFGGLMKGEEMIDAGIDSGHYANRAYRAWSLKSRRVSRDRKIEIGIYTGQTSTLQIWKDSLLHVLHDANANKKNALTRTRQWWQQFWDRSYIDIEGKDSFITRNYRLFRYQLACNAYGKWPTKFNGGLFTFDPMYVDVKQPYSPDFRLWGGGTMTAQNQRLVYFPMLKNGDADMMKPQFDFYLRMLKNAELRSKVYWNHNGACFTEQIENFGLPNIMEYGSKRPAGYDPGLEYNPWLEYLWETVFEFCFMILETDRYEGADISQYIPLIESCLVFYDEHYRQLALARGAKEFDQEGKYIFYPSSAAETFKMAYNSTTVISALKVVLTRVLELPGKYIDSISRQKWSNMLQRIPAVPVREMNGHPLLAPAQAWARVNNSEAPQLYPVYPWGLYGIGKPGLDTAINTYYYDTLAVKFKSAVGWKQYNIFAARLGLTDEAVALTREKFKDGPHRFPAFWGPGFDWTPDHNRGGSAMIGLQEMLLQADGRKIYLLPAWPKQWNGRFKLHAPYNTSLQGTIRNGKVEDLIVEPASRRTDVILPNNL